MLEIGIYGSELHVKNHYNFAANLYILFMPFTCISHMFILKLDIIYQ